MLTCAVLMTSLLHCLGAGTGSFAPHSSLVDGLNVTVNSSTCTRFGVGKLVAVNVAAPSPHALSGPVRANQNQNHVRGDGAVALGQILELQWVCFKAGGEHCKWPNWQKVIY